MPNVNVYLYPYDAIITEKGVGAIKLAVTNSSGEYKF